MIVHFQYRFLGPAACGAKPWPVGDFSVNRSDVTCHPCAQLADAVSWDGEAQAYVALCQGCDGIVHGGMSNGRFSPFRGRVVDGETYCVGCYTAKAAALSSLTVPTC